MIKDLITIIMLSVAIAAAFAYFGATNPDACVAPMAVPATTYGKC
jgi:hypothetical protein